MRKDLAHHLDGLKALGVSEENIQYTQLKDFLEELSKYPKRDWNTIPDQIKEGTNKDPNLVQKVLVKIGL